MKNIDWNKASELGLIERINHEILHPMGLAMCRDTEDGTSPCLLIADDGKWQYAEGYEMKKVLTYDEIQKELKSGD